MRCASKGMIGALFTGRRPGVNGNAIEGRQSAASGFLSTGTSYIRAMIAAPLRVLYRLSELIFIHLRNSAPFRRKTNAHDCILGLSLKMNRSEIQIGTMT
jgi:hypothetical protein